MFCSRKLDTGDITLFYREPGAKVRIQGSRQLLVILMKLSETAQLITLIFYLENGCICRISPNLEVRPVRHCEEEQRL